MLYKIHYILKKKNMHTNSTPNMFANLSQHSNPPPPMNISAPSASLQLKTSGVKGDVGNP